MTIFGLQTLRGQYAQATPGQVRRRGVAVSVGQPFHVMSSVVTRPTRESESVLRLSLLPQYPLLCSRDGVDQVLYVAGSLVQDGASDCIELGK